MDEAFLHWFAGFVAGEGCFIITTSPRYRPRLRINLRDDDLDIILEIQEELGIGNVYRYAPRKGWGQPSCTWEVDSIAACQLLVKIFDRFPLRAKKQKDYEVWREAVVENSKPVDQRDQNKLKYLCDKIKMVRRYDTPDTVTGLDERR